jgi:hypothetical protein
VTAAGTVQAARGSADVRSPATSTATLQSSQRNSVVSAIISTTAGPSHQGQSTVTIRLSTSISRRDHRIDDGSVRHGRDS